MDAPFRVIITTETLKTDPALDIHHIEVQGAEGVWQETYGSSIEVEAFLRGAQAASSMFGPYLGIDRIERRKKEDEDTGS